MVVYHEHHQEHKTAGFSTSALASSISTFDLISMMRDYPLASEYRHQIFYLRGITSSSLLPL